eukprot:Skav230941  [mRNA]  locus=scaffold2774:181506:182777:- [translate_table: standard]
MWSHMATGARPASMAVGLQGDYAYFARRTWGFPTGSFSFSVVDISDPTNPWVVASFLDNQDQLGGLDMAIRGSYAYLVGDRLNNSGVLWSCDLFLLRAVSISDPTNPVIVHTMQLPNATLADNECSTSSGITIVDDYAFVVGSFGLAVVDISDPTDPVIAWLGLKPAYSGPYRYNGITILGDFAYISGVGEANYTTQCGSGYNWYPCNLVQWGYGLTVVNIADPSTPRLTGRSHTWETGLDNGFESFGSFFTANIAVVGDYAYLALQHVRRAFNVSDPSRPHRCNGGMDTSSHDDSGMVIVEGHACFATGSRWSCWTKASKASSGITWTWVDAWALGPAVTSGDYAYIAIPPGVAVYNISAPTNWIFVGSTPTTTRTSSTITTVTATATTTTATFDKNAAQAVAMSAFAIVLGVIALWQHWLA